MNYEHQIKKVMAFIGKNIDEKLTLTQLSDISCFSKYHFHRLFTAYTGLSLQQYIRWLRLKRAAHQLIVDKKNQLLKSQSMRDLNLMKLLREHLNKAVALAPVSLGLNQAGMHGRNCHIVCQTEEK